MKGLISSGYKNYAPSDVPSPFRRNNLQPFTEEQIEVLIDCHVKAIEGIKEDGFDGVQLHAAHGSVLSRFLSPYMNRRNDAYGGSLVKRTRILKEIILGARKIVGDFPIIIKVNCTDYIEGGTDISNFPLLAKERRLKAFRLMPNESWLTINSVKDLSVAEKEFDSIRRT